MQHFRKHLLTRVTAPASEPVSVEEAKLYLRVDGSEEDTLLGDMIVAARMVAEETLKRSLITQSWKLAYDDYLPDMVLLPMGPVNAIDSVTVVNRDTSTQAIESDVYYLNAARDTLLLDSVIFGFRIEIVYGTGYGVASAVPQPIRHGMLAHIAAMYDARGLDASVTLPEQALRLYMPFREVRL